MKIGIYIYDEAEVLDFAAPYEVFLMAARCSDDNPTFQMFLIGETGHMATARAGFKDSPITAFMLALISMS